MIHIRPVILTDVPALLLLMEQLGYPTTRSILEARLKRFLAHEKHGVAVACQENRVVGWISWAYSCVFVMDRTRIQVEGLVVDEACRGQRIGKQLMAYLEDIARSYAPCIIELTSGVRREKDGTHRFYKALGYHNDGPMAKIYLRKEIT